MSFEVVACGVQKTKFLGGQLVLVVAQKSLVVELEISQQLQGLKLDQLLVLEEKLLLRAPLRRCC